MSGDSVHSAVLIASELAKVQQTRGAVRTDVSNVSEMTSALGCYHAMAWGQVQVPLNV